MRVNEPQQRLLVASAHLVARPQLSTADIARQRPYMQRPKPWQGKATNDWCVDCAITHGSAFSPAPAHGLRLFASITVRWPLSAIALAAVTALGDAGERMP